MIKKNRLKTFPIIFLKCLFLLCLFFLFGCDIDIESEANDFIDRHKPIANAGSTQIVQVGNIVYLDGSKSENPDNSSLNYRWELVSKPSESIAKLINSTDVAPTFIVDKEGVYSIKLVVYNGTFFSEIDSVQIFSKIPCSDKIWNGDFQILTQSDICRLAGYTQITGNLRVGDEEEESDSVDLVYKEAIETYFLNLEGLECLTSIQGSLIIVYNKSLTSLRGLDNLTHVGGSIEIRKNEELKNIEGLAKISEIDNLYIVENNSLQTLDGLAALKTANSFIIDWNDSLTKFGMPNLCTILNSLSISCNRELCVSEINLLKNQLQNCSTVMWENEYINYNKECN